MLFSLIATFLVGAAVGVMLWAGFRTMGRKAPGFLLPMAVGGSMLGYTIWNEYSWFGRTLDGMPQEVKVVKSYGESVAWAPWTYLVARTNRFVAVDMGKARSNPKFPSMILVETLIVHRTGNPAKVQQMIDCQNHRFTDLPASPEFDQSGLPIGVHWSSGDVFPELIRSVCADG